MYINIYIYICIHIVFSLMNITIDLKFIFIIAAFPEYNSHLQDITS